MSNPLRPGIDPEVWTTTTYDGLSRARLVTTPDGATVTTDYLGNETTVTDQAGKSRRSLTDGLGRLIQVVEDPFGLAYQTNYSYDALDDLTTVNQGVQTRSFVYDSLKRLTSATNPESGTMSYQYDANGNLISKTDARAVTTSFSYDALNRVTSKTYTDSTPAVSYFYDAGQPASVPAGFSRGASTGRLTAVTSAAATNFYGYDTLGRVVQSFQRTDGVDYGFSYAYNLAGAVTSETYPSGRVVSQSYDSAGRIASVSGVKGGVGTTYGSAFSYTPHGAVGSVTLGNGLVESTQFNSRLHPTSISLGSLLSLAYNYGGTNNNGNVLSMTITPGTGQTPFAQTFTYDPLNRLQSAIETVNASQTWKQTNGFDQYGNRWIDQFNSTGNVMGPISSQSDVSSSNNRIQKAGYAYDTAGNMTAEPGKSYTFDGENKIVSALVGSSTSNYVYDGEGRRVKKTTPQGTTVMVYDASARMVAEYADTAPAGPGGTQYASADHLGTPRVWTNSSGAVISRHDYLPFGEDLFSGIGARTTTLGYSSVTQADGQRNQFTQKERDTETNLDYFLARYYSSAHGRFTGIDPLAASADPQTPQSWNRYAYTIDNPLVYIDPTGELYIRDTETGALYFNADINSQKDFDKAGYDPNKYQFVGDSVQFLDAAGAVSIGRPELAGHNVHLGQSGRTATAVDLGDGSIQSIDDHQLFPTVDQFVSTVAAVEGAALVIGGTGGAAAYVGGVTLGGSGVTTLGLTQGTTGTASTTIIGVINQAIYNQLERQLAKDGAASIYRALRSAEKALEEHLAKLPTLQYKSQVEGTIRNISNQIETIKNFIKDKGL